MLDRANVARVLGDMSRQMQQSTMKMQVINKAVNTYNMKLKYILMHIAASVWRYAVWRYALFSRD